MKRRHTSLAVVVRFAKRRAPAYIAKTVVYSVAPSVVFDNVAHHTTLSIDSVAHTATDTLAVNTLSTLIKYLVHV